MAKAARKARRVLGDRIYLFESAKLGPGHKRPGSLNRSKSIPKIKRKK